MSQELSHQVLVPFAGITTTSNTEFIHTAGEAVTEIFSSDDLILTQGFQQPAMIFKNEIPPSGNGVKVYPNPVTDILNIELFGDKARSFRIDLINIAGIIISTEKKYFSYPFWSKWQYPVEKLSRGIYFVRIISDDGLIIRTFKIDKM